MVDQWQRARKLALALRHPLWRKALVRRRVLASGEHLATLSGLAVGTVIDIGANRGQFALLSRALFPDATIHAFEPLPRPAEVLRRVFGGDARVIVHEVAIDSDTGTRVMHVSARDDSSSLLPIGGRQVAIHPETAEAGRTTVRTSTLGHALEGTDLVPPVLLKIDVQGNELRTLQACRERLREVSHVLIEASFEELYVGQALADEVLGELRSTGFVLRAVDGISRDRTRRPVQADFLFSRLSDCET